MVEFSVSEQSNHQQVSAPRFLGPHWTKKFADSLKMLSCPAKYSTRPLGQEQKPAFPRLTPATWPVAHQSTMRAVGALWSLLAEESPVLSSAHQAICPSTAPAACLRAFDARQPQTWHRPDSHSGNPEQSKAQLGCWPCMWNYLSALITCFKQVKAELKFFFSVRNSHF